MKKNFLLKTDNPGRSPDVLRCLIVFVLLCPVLVRAQSTVTGTVTDENGEGMPGVNIIIKSTTQGTTSDASGAYSISVPSADAVIAFSFIGYNTQEVTAGARTTIDVRLVPNVQALEEIVVVGYGTQKKADVTGSIVSVRSDVLKEVPAANIQQALQGRAAGVEIQRIGTTPGSGARIRVRGERTINGSNDPLIVLDGIPFEGGNLNDINQDEIASIDVLKDASATAIYGSRGANGVILITTKRGEAGETKLTVDSYYGITTVARKYPVFNADEYRALRDISPWNQGYMPEELESIESGRSTDWQDQMYEKGFITNHNVNLSGGSEKNKFMFGAGYFKETTVLPGQDFTRFSLRPSADFEIGKRLKAGFASMNSVTIQTGNQFVNPMFPILSLSPLMPAYNEDGSIFQVPSGNVDDQAGTYSPLLIKEKNDSWEDKTRGIRTFNSLYAEVKIIEGLRYRLNLGLDYRQEEAVQFQGADSYFRPKRGNTAYIANSERWGYTLENLLIYDKEVREKHRFTFTGLFSAQEDNFRTSSIRKDSITADFIQYYDLGQSSPNPPASLAGQENYRGLLSYMGRLNYAFDDRFLLTFTYRRDGSSALQDKWHQYPALAIGWNLTNETFMQNVPVINNFKLRAGWGETSNQSVAPYQTLGGVSGYITQGTTRVPVKYNYGPKQVSGYYVSVIPSRSLEWEFTQTVNVGFDFGVLQNRITGTIDWYNAKTTGILYSINIPPTSGVPSPYLTNIGEMENKGLEVSLSSVNIKSSSGFTWSTDLNVYFNRNKLISLNSGFERDIANGLHIGHPLTAIYDYEKLGIWQIDEAAEAASFGQVPGQLKLKDISGPEGIPDGIITPEHDRKVIGSNQAKWQGGITNRFAYKGFDLSFVTYIRYGGTLVSGVHQPTAAYLTVLDGKRNSVAVDYWTPTNPTNSFPMPSTTITPPNATTAWSTLGYYDASFVKVRSINLGYSFPKSILSNLKIQSLRMYVTAQNPFLLYSPYVKAGGVDPEPTGTGANGFVGNPGNIRGGNNGSLTIALSTPPTRSYIFGINVTF